MARRPSPAPEPQRAVLTVDQMRRGIARLNKWIEEVEAFEPRSVQRRYAPEVKALSTSIEETLGSVFGPGTIECNRYRRAAQLDLGARVTSLMIGGGGPEPLAQVHEDFEKGKQSSIALLRQAVRFLEEETAEHEHMAAPPALAQAKKPSRKVFVVPVHDEAALQAVARFLEKIELEDAAGEGTQGGEARLRRQQGVGMTGELARTAGSFLAGVGELAVPSPVMAEGERAAVRYVEFFTAHIRNPNTRAAYARAASAFFAWCERRGLALPAVRPLHVASYVELIGRDLSAPSVKQRLAAIRMLFDWLVVGQAVPHNPAAAVRGPKHSAAKGKTHMPSREEAKALLAAIDTGGLVGLRDRALIGVLLYTFARVTAATAMRVGDYYPTGKRWWVRLHENGGKHHEMPCHHTLQDHLDAYIAAAGIEGDKRGPLFRTAEGRAGRLTDRPMAQPDVYRMIGRRAAAAGVATRIGCHSWRARGITAYLENGGLLEHAQQMAGHASARTTKLYDRRGEQVSLDEVERIAL